MSLIRKHQFEKRLKEAVEYRAEVMESSTDLPNNKSNRSPLKLTQKLEYTDIDKIDDKFHAEVLGDVKLEYKTQIPDLTKYWEPIKKLIKGDRYTFDEYWVDVDNVEQTKLNQGVIIFLDDKIKWTISFAPVDYSGDFRNFKFVETIDESDLNAVEDATEYDSYVKSSNTRSDRVYQPMHLTPYIIDILLDTMVLIVDRVDDPKERERVMRNLTTDGWNIDINTNPVDLFDMMVSMDAD